MIKGIVFALLACFIWGLIFIVPGFMSGFSSLEIALGRYTVYGILSSLIFCRAKFQGKCRYPLSIWIKALYFSLICTMGYYTFLVLALRYASPAICALVLGISPITIAFYGNWREKEIPFKNLIIPSILIVVGLVIINLPHFEGGGLSSSYVFGLGCCLISLSAWSWYVVANSRFLNTHPEVSSSDWSTLIGVASIVWVMIFAVIFQNQLQIDKYFTPSPELRSFLIGSAILGLICSWVGAFLWNRASLYLPVSLAGQLTIFETVFGVIFVYLLKGHFPPMMESIGIVVLLIAVVYGIRQFSRHYLEDFDGEGIG